MPYPEPLADTVTMVIVLAEKEHAQRDGVSIFVCIVAVSESGKVHDETEGRDIVARTIAK